MQLVETWRGLHASERSLAKALAYKVFNAEAPFTVVISLTDLEIATSLHRASVARGLNAFEAAGWIMRKREQRPGKGHVETTIELLKTSRFQELTDAHRNQKDPSRTTRLASPTMRPALVPPCDQLNKEEESFKESMKSSKDPSSPPPSSRPAIRPDDVHVHVKTSVRKPPLSKELPACAAFVESVRDLCRKIPGSRKGFHGGDRKVAEQWWADGISLRAIEEALVLGVSRRVYRKDGVGPPAAAVSSLKYFVAVVEEVWRQPVPATQLPYLRMKIEEVYRQKPVELTKQAWALALKEIRVRIDPQMSFWENAEPFDFKKGVLTIAAPADYREEQHGKREDVLGCLRHVGLAAEDLLFVKTNGAGRSP